MTAGEFVYLIKADKSQLNKALDDAEKEVKQKGAKTEKSLNEFGNKVSAWTIAKGQMIAQFAVKAFTKITDIASKAMTTTIKAYATFEQLEGGAELLFGSAYEAVMKRAANAYETVQMSMNDYLDAVNGYAVGLKTSLGGDEQAAADLADRIITAQADIVAATGRSREAVQNAFAGVMRGNFMMLDNLGLGIKGSKEGMEDVIKAVNEWNKTQNKATKYQIGNLADMENALVDYVEMCGMAGYAEAEASKTIEGTLERTKAAWQNLLVAFGSGKDVKAATKKLAESAKLVLKNVLPVAKNTIQGIGDFVTEMIPEIGKWIHDLATELKKNPNPIVQFIGEGILGLEETLHGLIGLVTDFEGTVNALKKSDDPLAQFIGNSLATIQEIFTWILANWEPVATAVGAIVAAFAVGKIVSFITNLNPVTLILGAIASAALLIATNWESIKETVIGIWNSIKDAAEKAYGAVTQWFNDRRSDIANAWGTLANWFNTTVWEPLTNFFTSAWDTISQLWTNTKQAISQAWSGIASWFNTTVWEPIKNFFEPIWNFITQLWTDITTKISDAWNGVKEVLDPIIQPIKAMFEGVVSVVSEIWNVLKNIFGLGDKHITVGVDYVQNASPSDLPPELNQAPSYQQGIGNSGNSGSKDSLNWAPSYMGGGFAKGMLTVPYDGYALLHRGEQILTKSQARQGGGEVDYEYIGNMIGYSIREAMEQINVLLNGNKVGDLSYRRTEKRINSRTTAVLHSMGGI